jgi:hypothetical protein
MAVKYLSKTMSYGIWKQTNWATPGPANSIFKTVPYNAGVSIFEPDVSVGRHNTTGQIGIHREIERFFVDGRSGLPKVNFSMPVDKTTLAPHLGGALWTITQGGAGTYTKAITAAGLAGTVDFQGDATEVYTIACDDTASADDGILLENAIIDELMNFEQTTSGTWTTTTFTPMSSTDLYSLSTFTVDAVDWSAQVVRGFTFNVKNNVTSNAATTAGKPNQYDVTPEYRSTILLDYNATTEKALKDFQDGATVVATIASSLGAGVDGFLSIALTGGKLERQPFVYNGEFAALQLDVLWHSTAGATPVTISLVDSTNYSGWYAAP